MEKEKKMEIAMNTIKNYTVMEIIREDSNLQTLGIDSLKIVDLIVELEDNCEVEFNDADLNPANVIVVKDILDLLCK